MLRSRAYKPIRRCHEDLEYFSSGSSGVDVQRGQHAGLAVLLLLVIFGLDQAIREDKQEIAGRECGLATFIMGVAHEAEGHASGLQTLDRA